MTSLRFVVITIYIKLYFGNYASKINFDAIIQTTQIDLSILVKYNQIKLIYIQFTFNQNQFFQNQFY
jgi:hypothetical protein